MSTRTELAEVGAGLVLLTNVLHALDPDVWCDALLDAWNAIRRAQQGIIVVTEIYPLLAPERFAVPVPPHWLADLFIALGFKVAIRHFAIHGSQSYCLVASSPGDETPSHTEMRDIVIGAWRQLRGLYLQNYEGLGSVAGMTDQQMLLNSVFGLARVTSCLAEIESKATEEPR